MKNVAYVFPGQGVQKPGMALDLYETIPATRQSGADAFVEFGPKGSSKDGVLTGNIHALDPSLTAFNIRDLSTIRDNPSSF